MNPSQNVGVETPTREIKRARWSGQRSRFMADHTPNGMLTNMMKTKAMLPSMMEAGRNDKNSCITGLRET